MSKIPKVRIQYSWLLEGAASEHIRKGLKIGIPVAPPEATKKGLRNTRRLGRLTKKRFCRQYKK